MSRLPDPMDGENDNTGKAGRRKRTLTELLQAAATRPVLDPEEVGAFLGIGTSTAYRLIAAGKIRSIQIPGTTLRRVRRSTLELLMVKWERNGRRRSRARSVEGKKL